VVVASLQDIYVHGDSGVLSKRLENVRDHLAGKLSNHLTLQSQVDGGTGTVGKINDGAGQSLVEGSVAVSETLDPNDGTEGLLEGGSESEGAVFGGMVVVNWQSSAIDPRLKLVKLHEARQCPTRSDKVWQSATQSL
jgi:hypothetical protein